MMRCLGPIGESKNDPEASSGKRGYPLVESMDLMDLEPNLSRILNTQGEK